MAGKRETAAEKEARLLAEQQADALTDFVADPMEAVRAYMASAGLEDAESFFHIYRVVDDGKRPDAFLYKCKPEDYDPEKLGQSYGSGTYRIKVYVKDENHPNGVIRAAPKFGIEMPANWKPREEQTLAAVQPPQQLTAADIALAVASALKAAMPAAPTRKEMLEEMRLMAEMFKPAAVTASGDKAPSLLEQAQTFAALKSVFASDAPAAESTAFERMAVKGLELFSTVKAQAQAQPATPGQPQLPAPTLTPEQEEEMILVRMAVRHAVKQAEAKVNPREFAEEAFDDIPESMFQSFIASPTWFDEMAQAFPAVVPHREWFELVRLRLVELNQPEGEETAAQAEPLQVLQKPAINAAKGEVKADTVINGTAGNTDAGTGSKATY